MAYRNSDAYVLPQLFANTDTTQKCELGKVCKGFDPTYGEGEFIYLAGLASTAVGELVIYDQKAGTTTRAITTSRGPCAIAMSANVASQYGWYQVKGSAVGKTGTVVANALVYATATPGTMDDAVVATAQVLGAIFKTADGTPAAGFAVIELDRPSMGGTG